MKEKTIYLDKTMTKSQLFRLSVALGSVFMILLIIVYWENVGTAHLYLHTSLSKPFSPQMLPLAAQSEERTTLFDIEFLDKFLNLTLAQNGQENMQIKEPPVWISRRPDSVNMEENVRGYDWSSHDIKEKPDQEKVQAERKRTLRQFCANASFSFPWKERSFDDIPNQELDHLIVDDHHGIIYCYVPKVACTNWKRIMIVLSESLSNQGILYQDPLNIPRKHVHSPSNHLTFNKFWHLYGKLSRHMMKIKLKKYTKFLFVRDPFVRLISAFRSKFELENDDFYRSFAVPILKLYSNFTNPPASVGEAFSVGMKVSFSEFIQYLLDPLTEKERPFNEHWRQVYHLCHPCQIEYDFVGKLETVDEDAVQLLRLLGVDKLLQFPPSYRNRTVSSWEEDWFARIPLAWRQQLYKLYEADFLLFGYSKPENLLKD